MVEMICEHPSCSAAGRLRSDPAGTWFLTQFGINTDNPSMGKAASAMQFFCLPGARLCREYGQKDHETKLLLCVWVFAPTCMFVVGRGLWSLCVAALLEEEGGSFDHEEALTEAGKKKRRKTNSGLKKAIKGVSFFIVQRRNLFYTFTPGLWGGNPELELRTSGINRWALCLHGVANKTMWLNC